MTTTGRTAADAPYSYPHRAATPADAGVLAELVNIAGEGLPLYLWGQLAGPGQSPWEIGRHRAMRDTGAFSYRNTVVREDGDRVVAALMGYSLPDMPDPSAADGLPPMFVPLQQLEDMAAGTWYVNVVAAFSAYRGRGFGSQLLHIAEGLARQTGRSGLSLVVSDANAGARRLYERLGYVEQATRRMVKDSWVHAGNYWVLLVRRFEDLADSSSSGGPSSRM